MNETEKTLKLDGPECLREDEDEEGEMCATPLKPSPVEIGHSELPKSMSSEAPVNRMHWLKTKLERNCVFAAHPGSDTNLTENKYDRVLLLSEDSGLWIKGLHKVKFSHKSSYNPRESVSVYRKSKDGDLNWIPSHQNYGMDENYYKSLTEAGISVEVAELPQAPHESASGVTNELVQALFTQLEMAACGVAPAVLAAFVVFDKKGAARGTMVVSQLHTFTLSDVMRAVRKATSVDDVNMVHTHLRAAARGVAEKLAHLAKAKVIKLSLTPKSVVFASSNIVLKDPGFEWKEFKNLAGSPFLVDYDSRLTYRLALDLDYNEHCALALMGMVLLSAVKAEFGDLHETFFQGMVGRDASGSKLYKDLPVPSFSKALASCAGGAAQANFYSCLSRTLTERERIVRGPPSRDVFRETLSDYESIAQRRSGKRVDLVVDGRLTFGQLVAFAMGLRVADFNEEDDPEAQELEKRARERFTAVANARAWRRMQSVNK